MEELYVWMAVSIALSGSGTIISLLEGMKQRSRVLDSLPLDTTESILDDEKTPREHLSAKTLVHVFYSLAPFIYTLLVTVMVFLFSPLTTVQQKVAVGGMLAIGLSSMFANIGRAIFYKESMNGLNDWDGGSVDFYGQYSVFLVLPETTAIYGLLYAILGITLSGITTETTRSIGMAAAESYYDGGIVLGLSAIAAILMGVAFRRTKPLYKDLEYFGKKMTYTVIPHFINIIGLNIAIVLLVFSGMMD